MAFGVCVLALLLLQPEPPGPSLELLDGGSNVAVSLDCGEGDPLGWDGKRTVGNDGEGKREG